MESISPLLNQYLNLYLQVQAEIDLTGRFAALVQEGAALAGLEITFSPTVLMSEELRTN